MKALHLISSGGYYGAESMLFNLVLSQERAGCRSTIAVFHNQHQPNTDLYQRAKAYGLDTRLIRCKGRADWSAVREISKLVCTKSITLLHTHGYKADLYGYLAARQEKKPIVATCHNWIGGSAALGIYNFLDRMVLKEFGAIAAVSRQVARRLAASGIPVTRLRVIANGIDTEALAKPQPAAFPGVQSRKETVIGMVARLDLKKGYEYLIEALASFESIFGKVKVVFVGDGPDRGTIESIVRKHGLQSLIVFAGQRSDMPSVYAALDIFVLPSLNEGLPMTLLEAMAAGKPVIATRVGAIPEVIHDGETGLLVEPRNVNELKRAIARLFLDPELRRRLGNAAQQWIREHYTSDSMAQRYRQMYQDVLAGVTRKPKGRERLSALEAGAQK